MSGGSSRWQGANFPLSLGLNPEQLQRKPRSERDISGYWNKKHHIVCDKVVPVNVSEVNV